MGHLGVELDRVEVPRRVLEGGHGGVGARTGDGEALGEVLHGVAVAHPDGLGSGHALEEEARLGPREKGGTVLPPVGAGDLAAQGVGHPLHAVADAQDGDAQVEERRDRAWVRPPHRPTGDRPRG